MRPWSQLGIAATIPVHVGLVAMVAGAIEPARRAPTCPIVDAPIDVPLVAIELITQPLIAPPPVRARTASKAPHIPIARSVLALPDSAATSTMPPPARVALQLPPRWEPPALPVEMAGATPVVAAPALGPSTTRVRSRTFDIDVATDGRVRIRDQRNFRFGLERFPAPSTEAPTRDEDIERPLLNPVKSIGGTIATFDATDWLMRSRGIDPYASAKLAALDATRDERARIGARHRRDQLARTSELVRRSLDELARLPVAAQKQALLELWDDCAESGPAELVAAGAAARATIVEHVRARFPVGSPHAFTAAELAAFAKRQRSRARFDPYGAGSGRNANP